ncbi:MAG: hypothetical protein F6K00_02430 [Leptolyngbya sp. SIOISBB]|nr:hypothetical protein [Leptolyngbya sp. SIOISBB]
MFLRFAAGDANLYRYVFNSPTNYTDPSGNAVFPVIPIIIGGIVAPFIGDALWSPVQTPETCNDISPGLPWYLRIPAEVALGAGIGAAPNLARGLGRSIAQQLPQLLDDVARGVGSIGDDVGRALAGSGDELIPALPGGGRLPAGAIDDLNPAALLRSQGNPGGAGASIGGTPTPGNLVGSLDDINPVERGMVQELLEKGRNVEIVPRSNVKTPDFRIDGVPTELKTLTGEGRNTLKNAIQKAAEQGRADPG